MHEGTADRVATALETIAKCLLIITESLPKLPKDAKAAIADMKNPADTTDGEAAGADAG